MEKVSRARERVWLNRSSYLAPILSTFMCFSCGVKTAPKSNVVDLRPEIPYKSTSAKPPESKINKKSKAKEATHDE